MKKILVFILVVSLCLSVCGCGNSDKLAKTLIAGEWVSVDDICYFDSIDRKTARTILRFSEDGTCAFFWEDYRNGQLYESGTDLYRWKIEGGKIVYFSNLADSDEDVHYLEYSDGQLIGSTWYCDQFTYVHNADADNSTSWPVQVPESDDEKYNRAVSLYNEQKYKEALSIFNEIAEYADSSEYIDSCYHNIAKAAAKENFAGYWCWVSGTYSASNAVYSWEHNPYDKFFVDFETMTITQYFASPSLQFEKTHDFTIVNATCLKTTGFRLDSTTMYWHFVDGQVFVSSVSSVFDPNGKHQMPLMPVVE